MSCSVSEFHVAWMLDKPDAVNFDWSPPSAPSAIKKYGGRVAFDKNFFGETSEPMNQERRPAVARHLHAETRREIERDFDVVGNQLADDVNG